MTEDSHLNNTSLMDERWDFESEDSDDDVVVTIAPRRNECAVCGDRAVSNHYGAYICVSCAEFFERHVRLEKEIISCATGGGNCSTNRTVNINTCYFCRFNKCHDVNLMYELITSSPYFVLPSHRIQDEQVFYNYARTFTKCLKYMEQYYYKWLNSFPSFRRLSEERKKEIRLNTHERGAVMQLVERSLNVHQMLRLHNCFLYIGLQSLSNFILIIKDIQELRDHVYYIIYYPNHLSIEETCNVLKLDLILQNDVSITDTDLLQNNHHGFLESVDGLLESIIQGLQQFMTDMHEEFETDENFEQIESLSLFDDYPDIPEHDYPYDQIQFLP
ncbi:nuclear hormone receptor family member nhr-111-like isoform X1 [Centruroides sculpturatus]|uniref:nuclear hormone receptor family member nhr-111-like isoform X1 n=1 Tax=Centruroides sculpturatus TaxID=218467 RepID=UPI000C6CAB01|nr:nuclear hormone receptor family member nhr-111-like isoform X1 [Centruroides sculpturatus]XP_023243813.1 nuclear hormone receptor family member nhr-111-like isoform X1 [Centruroides sculpturatus]XP_023243820.1 nuclear hormone receptor family member nhr-111-like isoform X1 [Centruroides sculpturatus]XP_023243824.1 nuclear hormone receptor family member nhr-111-like isoform X1 [Centruroides sculpturatus]